MPKVLSVIIVLCSCVDRLTVYVNANCVGDLLILLVTGGEMRLKFCAGDFAFLIGFPQNAVLVCG